MIPTDFKEQIAASKAPPPFVIAALIAERRVHDAEARLREAARTSYDDAHRERVLSAAASLAEMDRARLDEVAFFDEDGWRGLAHDGSLPAHGPGQLERVVAAVIADDGRNWPSPWGDA